MAKSKNAPKQTGSTKTVGRVTKKDQLIKLLRTKSGADIKVLSDKLGWQQHTTRAALTGLRKAGYEISAEKPAKGGMSKYRILSVPNAGQPAQTALVEDAG
jgi:predicted transcriptional regulator